MSNPYIWGSLDRAVNDDTKIDQAIEIAIDAHKADPDAHLGEGEALQSHRAAEIIDHRAESVVNDKIRANARTYIAIVDLNGDGDFTSVEDACDYALSKGGGSIFVKAGTYTVSRELQLKYGVDIYGDGPLETILWLEPDLKMGLNVSGYMPVTVSGSIEAYWYEGESWIEYMIDGAPGNRELEYTYLQLPWGEGQAYYEDTPGRIYIWDNAPETGSGTDIVVTATVNASVSSDIVHINGWKLVEGLDTVEGQILMTYAGAVGVVESYLGDGDFKLRSNAAMDCYLSVNLWFEGDTGRMSIISGVTIDYQGFGPLIAADGSKGRLFIRDTTLLHFDRLFFKDPLRGLDEAKGVVFEDTIFSPGPDPILMASYGTFRNCTFNLSNWNVTEYIGGYNTYFENCTINGSMSASVSRIRFVYPGTRFQSCVFLYAVGPDMVNNSGASSADPSAFVTFGDCIFTSSPRISSALFKGRELVITGCRFFCSNTVGLDSSTRNSIFVANQGRGTVAAQPTNCLVANNGFWTS